MGKLIVFEGIDGSGKSTQIDILNHTLQEAGQSVVTVREPGGTQLSEKIRSLLLTKENIGIGRLAELFLFSAARTQVVEEVIRPALDADKIILCDRFTHSTAAYQGYGRELAIAEIIATLRLAAGNIEPDLVILLDLPVETGFARIERAAIDRMEDAGYDFMERVRQGYLKLALKEPQNWLIVDGTREPQEIAEEIELRVKRII